MSMTVLLIHHTAKEHDKQPKSHDDAIVRQELDLILEQVSTHEEQISGVLKANSGTCNSKGKSTILCSAQYGG